MKKCLLLFLLVTVAGFSQSLSQYKYVIVPSKFDAQKKAGQFGLNNLTKLFLEKNGYTVFYDTDILPGEVSGESCNKAYIDVFENNSMRTTKLRVEIKDCRNAVLFVSDYGESMEKDNNVAYNIALRSAFKSFDTPEYRYNPNAAPEKTIEAIVPNPEKTGTSPAMKNLKPVQPESGRQDQPETVKAIPDDVLNAQPIENGYQLVDKTPKVVLKIYITSSPDVFIGENEQAKGVVVKKSGQWVFEYYRENALIVKPLNIKF